MDRVAAGHDGGRNERGSREVRAPRVGGADADRLVCELRGERLAVGLAVRDDGLDAERPARAQDSERDLAAIRDQDPAEHAAQASAPTVAEPTAAGSTAAGSTAAESTVTPLDADPLMRSISMS